MPLPPFPDLLMPLSPQETTHLVWVIFSVPKQPSENPSVTQQQLSHKVLRLLCQIAKAPMAYDVQEWIVEQYRLKCSKTDGCRTELVFRQNDQPEVWLR